MKGRCITGCGRRAVHDHHVCYQQHVRRYGGDLRDPANLIPLCMSCHAAHHAFSARIPMKFLRDQNFEYARRLMGAGAAFEYFKRRYSGNDPRLDALLETA